MMYELIEYLDHLFYIFDIVVEVGIFIIFVQNL